MLKLAKHFELPDEVATQTTAILGIRGSGKSNTAGVFVEELLDVARQVLIIDPTDCHWGLRSSADGKKSGYPILVFGGDRGDLPLTENDGKVIAQFLVETRASAILSLRGLANNAACRRLVTALFTELYYLKGKIENRTPLTVVIDEAPLFVPQRMSPDVAQVVGATENLIARGRNVGFGVVLISQRTATINKDVLTQANTIIAHRLTAPQDRKALKEWFEQNCDLEKMQEILSSLASMKNGQAWIWAPQADVMQQVQVRMRKTFDSSATPKVGQQAEAPKKLAEVDLASLRAKMSAAVETAAANDPKKLKARVAALEKELAAGSSQKTIVPSAETKVKKIEMPILKAADVKRLEKIHDTLQTLKPAGKLIEQLGVEFEKLKAQIGDRLTPSPASRPIAPERDPATPRPARTTSANGQAGRPSPRPTLSPAVRTRESTSSPRPASGDEQPLGKGERAILCCCAQYDDGVTREQLSVLTGYKRSSRDTYLQRLRERGFVVPQGERLLATQQGIDFLGDDYRPLPVGEALRNYWLNKLDRGERTILEVLIGAHPNSVPRQQIDEVTGYKRSSRDTYLQRMSSKRLVVNEGGQVRASDLLFD